MTPAARHELIESHLPLVRQLARRFADQDEPLEDLVQVGTIGLIKAVDRYDAGRGVELGAFATPSIAGEIRHHLRDRSAPVRVPRRLQAEGVRVSAVTLDAVAEQRDAADPHADTQERLALGSAMRSLQPRERRLLHLRFVEDLSQSQIEPPKRYRNEWGQLLEHSPYCERDIRPPEVLETHTERGEFEVRVKVRDRLSRHVLDHHPLDVVAWDGYLYPWIFNIEDFEPITGRVHQPPPVHQTFQGHNFVVCSFVPRLFDYHPHGIPAPYNHSNINSDEVIYYCDGNFMSRKGIGKYDISLHPSGLPHGPQPGATEASIGRERTEELAVMVDTFHPLNISVQALEFEKTEYMDSWLEGSGE